MAKILYKTLSKGEIVTKDIKLHKMMFFEPAAVLLFVLLIILPILDAFGVPHPIPLLIVLFALWPLVVRSIEYYTTEQALTNRRIFYKTGLIRRDTDEIRVEAMETISVNQSIFGRLFGYGDIDFSGRGGTRIKFIFVPKPFLIKRNFESQLYESREGEDDREEQGRKQ